MFLVMAMLASPVLADTVRGNATVGVDSNYVFRGASLSNGHTALVGNVVVNDVIVNGLFVSAEAAAWNLRGSIDARADLSVGLRGEQRVFGVSDVTYTVSVNRYLHNHTATNYSEAALAVNVPLFGGLSINGEVAQIIADLPKDTYFEVGARYGMDRFWSEVGVGVTRDRASTTVRHNHTQAKVGYDLADNWNVFAAGSFGATNVSNQYWFGTRLSF